MSKQQKTVFINSRDLSYTIDTYSTFTGQYVDEGEIDYYRDEYKLSDADAEAIEFDYDHPAVVEYLAKESVALISDNLAESEAIASVTLLTSGSPQFYNYTTDHYTAVWLVNPIALKQYALDHAEAYTAFVLERWSYEFSKAKEDNDEDTTLTILIDFYTSREYTEDEYLDQMFEVESDAWRENMTLTPDAEELIRRRESELEAEEKQTKMDLEA